MKQIKLLLIALLMTVVCYGQNIRNYEKLGSGAPTANPTKDALTSYVYRDTVNNKTYWWDYTRPVSVTNKWRLIKNFPANTGSGTPATAVLNTNGELVFYYADGTTINVGRVVGKDGANGLNGIDGMDGAKGDVGPQGLKGDKGDKGDTGATGPMGPQGPTGATGPQGLQGIQGPQGPQGPAGSGTGTAAGVYSDESPEYYKPAHAVKTFSQLYSQSQLDTLAGGKFKAAGILLTDQVDFGCIQVALNNAASGTIITFKGKYYINRAVNVPAMKHMSLTGGEFWATNQNTFDFFTRPKPADNNQAMVWAQYKIYYSDMTFMGNGVGLNQTAINVNSSFGCRYDNIYCENMAEGIRLTFQINVLVSNCYVTGCTRGWTVDWIAGFNPATYQSNHVKFIGCRAYGNARNTATGVSGSEYAFKFDQVSGGILDHCIIEGKSFTNGIIFLGANSTVVPDFWVYWTHFECEQGADVAFVNIVDLRQGIVMLQAVFGQYAALMVKAKAGSGTPTVLIENVVYWVGRSDGKAFESIGCNWSFTNNSGPFYDKPTIAGQFVGNNVQECTGDRCGVNKFKFYGLPSSIGGTATAAKVANISGNGLSRAFNPWLDKLPEGVELKQMEVGESEFNGKPSKKIVLVYIQSGMELFRSPEYPNYVAGYNAYVTEVSERNGYNFGEWPLVN